MTEDQYQQLRDRVVTLEEQRRADHERIEAIAKRAHDVAETAHGAVLAIDSVNEDVSTITRRLEGVEEKLSRSLVAQEAIKSEVIRLGTASHLAAKRTEGSLWQVKAGGASSALLMILMGLYQLWLLWQGKGS